MKRILFISLATLLSMLPAKASSYLAPVSHEGMTFPIARSDWFSVINFADDWNAPRMRKIDGRWRRVGVHEGNDIYAEPGTPVRAVVSGRVENIGWLFYSGWRVGIRAADGRYWFYAHMSGFALGLGDGDLVESGDVIGRVGNTGYGNTPGHRDEFLYHLHLGIQEANGTWVNPYPLMRRLYRASIGEAS